MSGGIRVLHVDDEPAIPELVAEYLTEFDERFTVTTTTDPSDVIDRLSTETIDCVVSDYDMPELTGFELLEAVRREYPKLPFILFTGKGSEDLASTAISAGVTDYLQKDSTSEQYELLANRITNAVSQYRAEQEATMWKKAAETATEGISIVGPDGRYEHLNQAYANAFGARREALIGEPWTVTVPDTEVERLEDEVFPSLAAEGWAGNSVGQRIDGEVYPKFLSLAELDDGRHVCVIRELDDTPSNEGATGGDAPVLSTDDLHRRAQQFEVLFQYAPDLIDIHDETGQLLAVNQLLCDAVGYSESELLDMQVWDIDTTISRDEANRVWAEMEHGDLRQLEAEYERKDGSTFPVDVHIVKVEITGEDRFFVIARDISEAKAYREELEAQNESLEEFSSIVSHDLRNPLNVAQGRLTLAQEVCETEHHDAIERSLERMENLIDDLLVLSREGKQLGEQEVINLRSLAADCWGSVDAGTAELHIEIDRSVTGDRSRLRQVLENLFRNAVEHGGQQVTITLGELPAGDGFYVEDTGAGISPEAKDSLFESGFSTNSEGTGFGLSIVKQVVKAHGWEIQATEGVTGGARFEIQGVEFVDTS